MALYERKPRHANSENVVIFQDKPFSENAENVGYRKSKSVLATSRVPLQDCTAAVDNRNIQSLATTKQNAGTENCSRHISKQAGDVSRDGKERSVHPQYYHDELQLQPSAATSSCSEHSMAITDHEQMELHPSVTAAFVPEAYAVRDEIFDDINNTGSTMMVDSPEESMCDDDVAEAAVKKSTPDDNYLCFAEYKADIYQYLRENENRYRARPDYMRKQMDITHSMRSILVDWMVEVAEEYKLERETMCLAVTYVDRFLSSMAVARGKLQLVGAAAMFIAAKYEEIYPPEVGEFVYITDNTYTKKQVLQMERMILRTLAFGVSSPTVSWFCLYLLREVDAVDKASFLALYLVELTLVDGERFLKYLPSTIAVCCTYVSLCTLGFDNCWDKLSSASGYLPSSLNSCLNDLLALFSEAATLPHPAIREKYAKNRWLCVSETAPISSITFP